MDCNQNVWANPATLKSDYWIEWLSSLEKHNNDSIDVYLEDYEYFVEGHQRLLFSDDFRKPDFVLLALVSCIVGNKLYRLVLNDGSFLLHPAVRSIHYVPD